MTAAHDPAIIKAQAALFNGERAEVRRYLREYADAGGDPSETLVRWIDAHTQEHRDEALDRLRELVADGGEDDPYVQLAIKTLGIESRFSTLTTPDRGRRMLTILVALALVIGGAALGGTAVLALNRAATATEIAQAVDTTAPVTLPTPTLVDRSVALPNSIRYATQYNAGVLRVTRIEDDSARVVNSSGALLTPIPGARFVAIEFQFECYGGICNNPPEARMTLIADKALSITPRENAVISGGRVWEAVARNRVTGAWVIFEVPLDAGIEQIAVYPNENAADAPPQLISLTG